MEKDLSQPHVHVHVPTKTTGTTAASESALNGLLVCDVIDEFISEIPEHINDMPAFCSNGVTRNEMEWKHLAFSMANEIIRLRKAN